MRYAGLENWKKLNKAALVELFDTQEVEAGFSAQHLV